MISRVLLRAVSQTFGKGGENMEKLKAFCNNHPFACGAIIGAVVAGCITFYNM